MIRTAVRQAFVKSGVTPCRICVAVSGGTDSTALLLAMAPLRDEGFDVIAAHVNHRLRAAESDGDEAFVRALCTRLGIELHVLDGTLDPRSVRDRGIEAAAREVRYARLREIRARYVATAHQKDDQAETVLMRLLTGSGIAGLRGIHPLREDRFLRPLLDVTRAELEAFLREENITPRTDSSNVDQRFLRNRVRTVVRELDATANLAAIAEQAQSIWRVLERAIDEAEREHADVREDETIFLTWPEDEWLRASLLHRHIKRLDPSARDFDATRLAKNLGKRTSVTKHLELDRNILRRKPQHEKPLSFEITFEREAFIPQLNATIHCHHQPPTTNHQLFTLPEGSTNTFNVRTRRPGDRFQPLGMSQPKKLKDFLIDRKIAAAIRDRLPLLVWNGEIVWVAGVEISERFKIAEDRPGDRYAVWLEEAGAADDVQR